MKSALIAMSLAIVLANSNLVFAQQFTVPPDTDPAVVSAFNEGTRLLSSGHAAEAAQKYAVVVKAMPNFGIAHYNYGLALGKTGRLDESVHELEKAAALQPNDPSIVLNLGTTYQLAGKYPEALETYKRFLSAFPNNQYSHQISMQMQRLQQEVNRNHGKSSAGQENYLSEAMAGGGGSWTAEKMPVAVFVADGNGVQGYREEFRKILQEAFLSWAEATGGKLTIAFVDKADQSAIKCSWTDNPRDLTSPVEGGKTTVAQTKQGKIVKADMIILTSNKTFGASFSDAYMRHVCLHEVGHAFGLAGHSSQPGDIMFAAANYEYASPNLSDRDRKTLYLLYSGSQ